MYGSGMKSLACPAGPDYNSSYGQHGYPPSAAMSPPSWKGQGFVQSQGRTRCPGPRCVLGLPPNVFLAPSHLRSLKEDICISLSK